MFSTVYKRSDVKKYVSTCRYKDCSITKEIKTAKENIVTRVVKITCEGDSSAIANKSNNISLSDDEQTLENSIFTFIGKLYSNNCITNTVVDEVVSDLTKFTESITNLYHKKLKSVLPVNYHRAVDKCLEIQVLEKASTEYRWLQYLKKNGCFMEPTSFFIGKISDDKKLNFTTIWTQKKCHGFMTQMRIVFKKYMELPNVFKEILNYIQDESSYVDKDIYSSLF